jgi:hypothetical protein
MNTEMWSVISVHLQNAYTFKNASTKNTLCSVNWCQNKLPLPHKILTLYEVVLQGEARKNTKKYVRSLYVEGSRNASH